MKIYFILLSLLTLLSCKENEELPAPDLVLHQTLKQLNNWETLSFTSTTKPSAAKPSVTSTVYKLKKVGYEPHLKLFFYKEMNQETSIYYKLASLAVVENKKNKITTFDYNNDRSVPKYLNAYMGDDDNLWGTVKKLNKYRNEIDFLEKSNDNGIPVYIYRFADYKLWVNAKEAVPVKIEMPDGKGGTKEITYSKLSFNEPLDEAIFTHPSKEGYVTSVFGIKKEPMLNIKAPAWTLLDVEGNKVSLDDFKGSPIFLKAWVSSCSHCMASLPKIKQIQKEFGDKVKIVTVNFDYDLEETKTTIKEKGIRYTVLQGDALFDQNYDLRSFPSYFVIDSNGIVVYSERGTIEGKKEQSLFEALKTVK